tara:strand:- start:1114 stop:3009 length:1896 start_codon:yes stop_codon:yes gene_type:complete
MSVIQKLSEGIVNRDLAREGAALLDKWERTGLLEGIDSDHTRSTMARLLENQAKELLRETSSMAAGDVEGFASVAFPIVRRVFGGLIANELVSVQPMSLPSGLIFFLDFRFSPDAHAAYYRDRAGMEADESLFGGGVVGQQVTGGVVLTGDSAEDSFYSLANGFSSPTGSTAHHILIIASGTVQGGTGSENTFNSIAKLGGTDHTLESLVRYDPDLSGSAVVVGVISGSDSGSADLSNLNKLNLIALQASSSNYGSDDGHLDSTKGRLVRRLTRLHGANATTAPLGEQALDPANAGIAASATTAYASSIIVVFEAVGSTTMGQLEDEIQTFEVGDDGDGLQISWPLKDNFDNVGDRALGAVVGASAWQLENNEDIPEIDIKVDSVAITAVTKKLKAKWTPELGQDLNAYHNLDAEVELTGILSEQIALEIDREIMNDLIRGASAGTFYWSRSPGMFLRRDTGKEIGAQSAAPDFTGTVSEWYETLVETMNDVSAQIHRKTLRGGANFVVCGPEVANVLEFTSGFRASVTADADRGTVGAVNAGSISKKWDVYVDPYFPRNVVLVGRKGSSFLESGYVYAPYVPLQMTPTIFGTEDFVPRKGVMTRYGKKMVRPDMYGLVIVRGLLGEPGGT